MSERGGVNALDPVLEQGSSWGKKKKTGTKKNAVLGKYGLWRVKAKAKLGEATSKEEARWKAKGTLPAVLNNCTK